MSWWATQANQSSPAQLRQQPNQRRPVRRHEEHDRFGLMGLLGVIRMQDPDLTTLALGTDLTTLGLPLNSSDLVYKTFEHPWAESPLRQEPSFTASRLTLLWINSICPAIKFAKRFLWSSNSSTASQRVMKEPCNLRMTIERFRGGWWIV